MNLLACVAVIFTLCGCTACIKQIDYRAMNIKGVEGLRREMLDERFDDIYNETSTITRSQVTRQDFIERIKIATAELKDIDEHLQSSRVEDSPELGVYRDENWSSLNLEGKGRKVNIQLDWDVRFQLCGMLISGDISKGGHRVFQNCD